MTIRKAKFFASATLALSGLALFGCASHLPETPESRSSAARIETVLNSFTNYQTWPDQAWLGDENIKLAYNRQFDMRGEVADEHTLRVVALQKEADLLFKLWDTEHMELLASKVRLHFPRGIFPVSDLPNYLRPAKLGQPIPFVVVAFFNGIPGGEDGKPTVVDTLRYLDGIVRKAGVQRLMFQCESYNRWVEFHSDPNKPLNSGKQCPATAQ